MKKVFAGLVLLTLAAGCTNTAVTDKLNAMEARLAKIEKRITPPKRQAPPPQTAAYNIPVGKSHVQGNVKAPVTVTVFSDYQCPYCTRVSDGLLKQIMSDATLKGKVNLVHKHFPLSFHKDAKPAAKASLAAGEQGAAKFWAMSDKLYANQRSLTPENFTKWAKEIGLNVKKFNADLKKNDAAYEAQIKADMELGIKTAKVRGTPSIFVAGWELRERSVQGVKNLIKTKKLATL